MLVATLALGALLHPQVARAEYYGFVYLGQGTSGTHAVSAWRGFPDPAFSVARSVHFAGPTIASAGLGDWFTRYPWAGWALEIAHANVRADQARLGSAWISAYLTLRGRFAASTVRPFGALGFGLALESPSADLRPEAPDPIRKGETAAFHARAGVEWAFARRLGLLGEYRATLVDASNNVGDLEGMHCRFTIHQALLGLSWRAAPQSE